MGVIDWRATMRTRFRSRSCAGQRAAWVWVVACALALTFSHPARSASIGIFADHNCTECSLDIPLPPGIDTLYVRLSTDGLPGYTNQWELAVQFRVEVPSGWYAAATLTANPGFVYGDPLSADGVHLSFWGGHLAGECLPLYAIAVVPAMPGAQGIVRILPATLELPAWCSEPMQCPYAIYERFEIWCECIDGGAAFVNMDGDCSVGVQPATWTGVKSLYD